MGVEAATAQQVGTEQATDGVRQEDVVTTAQSGAVSFPEVVRAHYAWERAGCVDGSEAERFRSLLKAFREEEGELLQAYWATRRPSAAKRRRERDTEEDED